MTHGALVPTGSEDWVAEVTQAFARTVGAAVSDGSAALTGPAEAARLLDAVHALLLPADQQPPGSALHWHERTSGTRTRLAVGVLPDAPWGASHDAALEAMAAMLAVAEQVEGIQSDERHLRAAQAGAQAGVVRKLEYRQRLLNEMVQVQRSLARRAPFQEKLDLVTAAVARVLDVELVAIRMVDPLCSDELVVVSGSGLDPDQPLRSPVSGSGVGGTAFRCNDTVTVENYSAHPAAMASYQASVRAAMGSPVQQLGRAVGSIVAATLNPGRRFDDADRQTLRAFADQASIAVTEQHLFTEMQQGLVDPLTGLANRARFHDQLASALDVTTGAGSGPAVLFVDLDGFKVVNDALGHGVGDELLVKVAQRLRSAVSDSSHLARFGGDEFTLLLPEVRELGTATDAAAQILGALDARFAVSGHEVSVSASVGIAWNRRRPAARGQAATEAAVDMLRCADTAMYRAKASGRNRYVVFEPRMHDELLRTMARESQLRSGVERDELVAHFQPIVDLESGACAGAEALVRWHRGGEVLSPAHFMDLAEETGLIVTIGRRVLRGAATVLAGWAETGRAGLSMSVNLSPRELESPSLVQDVRDVVDATGAPAKALVVELTESALMKDVDQVAGRLQELRELGVRVAIDDFGTGYSSLARLRWLPIDILKIDRSFVKQVDSDPGSRAMLLAVLQLATALDLQVVAEGVERSAQRHVLTELGCRWGQGFLFSPALPAAGLDAYMGGADGSCQDDRPEQVPASVG